MKYLCMPADFSTATINKYVELNNSYQDFKVLETYGQITTGNFLGSGRPDCLLPKVNIVDLANYVKFSRERNIGFNYTINASHMNNIEFTSEGVYKIKWFLYELFDAGVRSLTVSLPPLIDIIKATRLDFEIKASVVCQITNANKATLFKELGVNRIVVDESVNRDFSTLKRIRNAFGEKVEVIVNSVCHIDCINRMFHYNQISSDSLEVTSEASIGYYAHRCMSRKYKTMSNVLKLSWVRPEDIKYLYNIGINYFKIQGRQTVLKGDPVRAAECYLKESYNGNLVKLLDMFLPTELGTIYVDNKKLEGFIKTFYENEGFCKKDCVFCGYCEEYAKKCINFEKEKEIFNLRSMSFSQNDPFIKLISPIVSNIE